MRIRHFQKYESVEPKLNELMDMVCSVTSISKEKILSLDRHIEIKDARNLFYYLTKINKITTMNVGRFLNRDHSTVVTGRQQFKNLLDSEERTKELFLKATA